MAPYTHLLFDADNTLLDFSGASKLALFKSMKEHQLHCNDDIYKVYKEENGKVWDAFEDKKITAEELRPLRFKNFFRTIDVKGFDPGAFNSHYLNNLIQLSEMYDGIRDMIGRLQKKYTLGIITNGLKEVQRARFERLEFLYPFEIFIVSDEIGHTKPSKEYFDIAVYSVNNNIVKEEILVVGDNLMSDILGANNYGLQSCWVSQGKTNDTDVVPNHTINSVTDLM